MYIYPLKIKNIVLYCIVFKILKEKTTDCFAVYRGRNFRMGVSKTRGRVSVRVDNPNPKTVD